MTPLFSHPFFKRLAPLLIAGGGALLAFAGMQVAEPWLLALAFFALSLALVLFFNIRLIPFLLLGGIVFGQLVRLKLGAQSSGTLLLIDIAVLVCAGIGGLWALITKQRFQSPYFVVAVLPFLFWMYWSLLWGSPALTTNEIITSAFYAIRFTLMILSIAVTILIVRHYNSARQTLNAFLIVGGGLVLLGFVQLLVFPNFAFMTKFGWDPHEGRLLSTYFDPNFFGLFLTMQFAALLATVLIDETRRRSLLVWAALGLTVLALLLTFSRSSYLAFLVALFIILLIRSWKLVLVTVLSLGLIAMTVPRIRERIVGAFTLDQTALDRIQSWREATVIIQDHVVTGVGYNAYGPAQLDYGIREELTSLASRGSDSSMLLIFATMGMIGALLFLWLVGLLLAKTVTVYRRSPNPNAQIAALAILGLAGSYSIHSQFVNSIFYPLLLIPFGILLAVAHGPWLLSPQSKD